MLGNCARPFPEKMVNPKSFVALYAHEATCESIYRAEEIQNEWQRQGWLTGDRRYDYMSMIGAIYEAGRLQGIREERRKKKRS